MKEEHPYLHYFDSGRTWKYLIIGTFPLSIEVRKNKTSFLSYFYGNKGYLWSIFKDTNLFPDFNFSTLEDIQLWQDRYSIGVTDVLKSCSRKVGKVASSDDADLVITIKDLNNDLKAYLLRNIESVKLIYFTSSSTAANSNSAYYWFKQLMGTDFIRKYKSRFYTDLPSPSGRFLNSRSVFSNQSKYHGLNKAFYNFLEANNYVDALQIAKATFEEKKRKVANVLANGKKASSVIQKRFPDTELNYPAMYRIERYRQAFMKIV